MTLGATVGTAIIAGLIGRRAGRNSARELLGAERADRLDRFIERRGLWAVVGQRFIPGVSDALASYAFGAFGVPLWQMAVGAFIGSVPRAFVYTALGASIGDLSSPLAYAAIAIWCVTAVVGAIATHHGYRKWRRHARRPTLTVTVSHTRSNHERNRSDSLAAGGLNWDSLPLKLFAGGNAKFWDPAEIDFSRDRADWEAMSELERDWATRLCAQFIAGEEAVTQDIQPFMAAMRAEGRLGDEMYLTQFAFEEAKHTQVFRMWLDAVGMTDDLQHYLDDLPSYRQMFYEELPKSLEALSTDPSPAAQVRASATYNHVIEGMMALTGYYAWHRICVDNGILPGMQELVRRIGDDERRHMAWGTFTCRRHVAADDTNWAVFEARMGELIPLALRNTDDAFALYDEVPFNLTMDEFAEYATDKGMRRLGTIGSARGRPLVEIDVDYSPLQLEDTFADEDRQALASSA